MISHEKQIRAGSFSEDDPARIFHVLSRGRKLLRGGRQAFAEDIIFPPRLCGAFFALRFADGRYFCKKIRAGIKKLFTNRERLIIILPVIVTLADSPRAAKKESWHVNRTFPETLSALRRERNISQRTAAAALHISQALLSHYENGAREPGLDFVRRACDYYGVTADYLLCRSGNPDSAASTAAAARAFLSDLRAMTEKAELELEALEEDKT